MKMNEERQQDIEVYFCEFVKKYKQALMIIYSGINDLENISKELKEIKQNKANMNE
ncbi:hypothetical protein [Butyrivibrio sp. YAB3001]|uniref:hypothetical protein n=1 Tax=Butyrivibrio sp. YAB3001 TaxID=1520812 RepID=UPI0008F624EC|nr:hypothetical protein [Butyrivibrio sp. YAB3001]SFB86875.1 hypothetical protein SAMN02910398_00934 [Butyrivibrio sp. YAB3001]